MPTGGGQSAPSSQTVTNELPQFLEDAYQKGIDRADAASQEEYVPYSGQRIANFNNDTQSSFNMTRSGVGQFMPTVGAAINDTASAATPFNAATFNQFMDPYKQNVTDEISRLGNRNFTENLLPQVNSQFTGGGMFGSTRNADILGRAARDTQDDITGKQGDYLSQGFQSSMNNYNTAMNRSLQAGSQLGDLAKTGQQVYGNDVNELARIGQTQETKNQLGLDTAYNQFLEQRDYPKSQIDWFNSVAHGIPSQSLNTQTKQSFTPQSNPISQALGLGGSLSALSSMAKGGRVRAKNIPNQKRHAPIRAVGLAYGC